MRAPPIVLLALLAWNNPPGRFAAAAVARFEPLACNAGGYGACLPASEADADPFFAANAGAGGVATIPCGTCVVLDEDGARYEWDGLDVRGRLVIPEGADVSIVARFILVQGELEIQSSQTPITNEPHVTITLTGTDEGQSVEHLIHPQNRDACGSTSCVVGKKAIVAAGGVLTVTGMPPDCPAWVHLEDVLSRDGSGEVPTEACRSFVPSLDALSSNRAHDGIPLVWDADPDDDETAFRSMRGRRDKYAFATFEFDPSCAPESTSAVYTFHSRVRVHAPDDAPTSVSWRLYWKSPTGGWGGVATVLDCPKLTESDGWASCTTSFSFGENMIGQGPMRMEGMSDRGEFFPDIDFSEVSFAYSHGRIDSLVVDRSHPNGDASACWGIGSELLIPSNTMRWDGDEVRAIDSISVSEETVTLRLSSPLTYKPTTSREDPETAAEVALLSRNVVWEADTDDPDPLHGGHVKVLNTPDRAQHISGVAVLGFGQQGKLGVYPFHFHLSENVHGSVLSKNVIRGSHQRCVVIHGSHGVELHQNVAYDNFGHCLMVGEDGIEKDNIVRHNLIAKTKNIAPSKMVRAGETDFHASSVWISNPQNDFVGNVCAGSESNGFWLEFQPAVKDPSKSAFGSSVNPQQLALGAFRGNVAHSVAGPGFRTYPNGYHPQVSAVFEDTLSYRNAGDGFFAHNSNNMILKGGLFSDNRISIDFDKADAMIVDGARLMGFSDLYKKVASESGAPTHCSKYTAQKELVGIQSHLWMVDPNQPFGAKIQDVSFSDFANQEGPEWGRI